LHNDRPTASQTTISKRVIEAEDRLRLQEFRCILSCNDATRRFWLQWHYGIPENQSAHYIPTHANPENLSDRLLQEFLRNIKSSAKELRYTRRTRKIREDAEAIGPFISMPRSTARNAPKIEIESPCFLHAGNLHKHIQALETFTLRSLLEPKFNLRPLLEYLLFVYNSMQRDDKVACFSKDPNPLQELFRVALAEDFLSRSQEHWSAHEEDPDADLYWLEKVIFDRSDGLYEMLSRAAIILCKVADGMTNVLGRPHLDIDVDGKRRRRTYRMYIWPRFSYTFNPNFRVNSNILRFLASFHPFHAHPWQFRGNRKLRSSFTRNELAFLCSAVETTPLSSTLTHSSHILRRGHFSAESSVLDLPQSESNALVAAYTDYLRKTYRPDLSPNEPITTPHSRNRPMAINLPPGMSVSNNPGQLPNLENHDN
jgi:hypothetical protein